jgi:hypothetical protein
VWHEGSSVLSTLELWSDLWPAPLSGTCCSLRVLIHILYVIWGKNCNNYAENIMRHRALVARDSCTLNKENWQQRGACYLSVQTVSSSQRITQNLKIDITRIVVVMCGCVTLVYCSKGHYERWLKKRVSRKVLVFGSNAERAKQLRILYSSTS